MLALRAGLERCKPLDNVVGGTGIGQRVDEHVAADAGEGVRVGTSRS
jgi:hypothetical protein